MKKVLIDGEVVDEAHAVVSVFDRGFLYGDSVFETVRTYGGEPFALDEHLERLARSASRVLIRLPVNLAVLAAEVHRGLRAAQNPESYVRIMITRGSGPLGLDPTEVSDSRRVIIVAPLVRPPPEVYEEGVSVVTVQAQRPTDATSAEGAKVGNYLVAVLATQEATRAGAYEALFLDAKQRVVEGASCNVFAARGRTLLTPAESDGILPGITRATVIDVAKELGFDVHHEALLLGELQAADEVFITSSIREIVPVVKVDERPIGRGAPGPIARQLLAALHERVGAR